VNVVVSAASPLINLTRAEQFELLAGFYDQIVIPLGLKVKGTWSWPVPDEKGGFPT
jgi:predicted nucleic acid-binding protein